MIANALQTLTRKLGHVRNGLLRRHARDDRQTLKDRALARRFRDTFEQELEMADVQGLHLYVKDGVVTLYGTVHHELGRELLLSFIRQRPGVKRVEAHLQTLEDENAAVEG